MSELQFPEIDFAIEPLPNLYELLADIRAKHRISTIRWFGQPASLITRYEDVLGFARRRRRPCWALLFAHGRGGPGQDDHVYDRR